MKSLLNKAINLAFDAHVEQLDKGGHSYVGHPLRVMEKMSTEEEKIVAVLHDVIEDSDVTLEHLMKEGYPPHLVEAIDALTKRHNEKYKDYINRVMCNPLALKVKIADIEDNMDLSRLKEITDKDLLRQAKYTKTLYDLHNKSRDL